MSLSKPEAIFFDTNVFIHLLRSADYEQRLERFLQGACLYVVSKIVLMELWAGARTRVEEDILRQYERAFPLIGFADEGFIEAGQVMRRMSREQKIEPQSRRRLTWDILIAIAARQNNAILVTENVGDFQRIGRFVEFEFVSP